MSFFTNPISSLRLFIDGLEKSSSTAKKFFGISLKITVLPIFQTIGYIFTNLRQGFNKNFKATRQENTNQTEIISNVAKNSIHHQAANQAATKESPLPKASTGGNEAGVSLTEASHVGVTTKHTEESAVSYKVTVKGDGNCFFHALALGLDMQDETAHQNLRQELVTSLNEALAGSDKSYIESLEKILKQEIGDWLLQESDQISQNSATITFLQSSNDDTTNSKIDLLATINSLATAFGLQNYESYEEINFDAFNAILFEKVFNCESLVPDYIKRLGIPNFHVGKIAWEVMAKSKNVKIVIHEINEQDRSNQYPVSATIDPVNAQKEVHLAFKDRHYDYLKIPNKKN